MFTCFTYLDSSKIDINQSIPEEHSSPVSKPNIISGSASLSSAENAESKVSESNPTHDSRENLSPSDKLLHRQDISPMEKNLLLEILEKQKNSPNPESPENVKLSLQQQQNELNKELDKIFTKKRRFWLDRNKSFKKQYDKIQEYVNRQIKILSKNYPEYKFFPHLKINFCLPYLREGG